MVKFDLVDLFFWFDMAGVYRSARRLEQEQGQLFSWAEAMMERFGNALIFSCT